MSKLKDFKPQRVNANKHSQRGRGLLDMSMRRDGYSAPMVAAKDGEIFIGSHRLEVSADVFTPDIEPIIVESDGTRPVIVRRTDIETADDPKAVRLGLADNRVAELSLSWNVDVLKSFDLPDLDLVGFDNLTLKELGDERAFTEDFNFGGLPDQDRAPFQQMTFTLHDEQAEQVREALKLSKGMGEFVDSPNENSNGNALARICEIFITEHDNG